MLVCTGVMLAAVTACSDAGEAEADCAQQVRLDGVVYSGWSATDAEVRRLGEAERASCDDTSEDAKGSYFGDDAERVTVWSFEGYPSDEVLGVRLDETSYTIFVADSLPDDERDRLVAELSASGS